MLRRIFMSRASLANLRFSSQGKGLPFFYSPLDSPFYLPLFHTVSGQVPWSHWQAISTSLDPASLQD
jgi:hypothetical protein